MTSGLVRFCLLSFCCAVSTVGASAGESALYTYRDLGQFRGMFWGPPCETRSGEVLVLMDPNTYSNFGIRVRAFKLQNDRPTKLLEGFTGDLGRFPTGFIAGEDGYLYGIGFDGGAEGEGTFLRFDPVRGESIKLADLSTGISIEDRIQCSAPDGTFYGVSFSRIFQITKDGEMTDLINSPDYSQWQYYSSLVRTSDGTIYAAAEKVGYAPQPLTILQVDSNGSSVAAAIGDGIWRSSLVEGPDGALYGFVSSNGFLYSSQAKLVRVTRSGSVSDIGDYDAASYELACSLFKGHDGELYGVAADPANGHSCLFHFSTSGQRTKLFDFNGYPDLDNTYAPLLTQGYDGRFYGTSQYPNAGRAFTLTPPSRKPFNRPPIARDDFAPFHPADGEPVVVPVLKNDEDADGDRLQIEKVNPPDNATVAIAGDRLLVMPQIGARSVSFYYTVSDGHGGEATARVFLARNEAGIFTGLDMTPDGPVFVRLAVSAFRQVTGVLIIQGRRLALHGSFDDDGQFEFVTVTGGVETNDGAPRHIYLSLGRSGRTLDAYFNNGSHDYNFVLQRSVPAGNLAGNYTLIFPHTDKMPSSHSGTGYAIARLKSNGSARAAGRLADNTPFLQGGSFLANRTVPLFASLYGDQNTSGFETGHFGGSLVFRNVEGKSDCDGLWAWSRPNSDHSFQGYGFTVSQPVLGSRLQTVSSKAEPAFGFGSDSVQFVTEFKSLMPALNRNGTAKLSALNLTSSLPPLIIGSRMDPTSGMISGNIGISYWKTVRSLHGILFQKQRRIYGYAGDSKGTYDFAAHVRPPPSAPTAAP